ncbi:hypothetical protein CN918_29295 [Priestia megaterium]|nr:hypothetical protein CN918_29295 [Priestia megaterium]
MGTKDKRIKDILEKTYTIKNNSIAIRNGVNAVKERTMVIKFKHGVLIAHEASTGSDNIISNSHELFLEEGMKVKAVQLKTMLVEITAIKNDSVWSDGKWAKCK